MVKWTLSNVEQLIHQKGMHLNYNIYVVVDKQCYTQNVYTGHQHNIFIQITNVLLLFICFKLVQKLTKYC